MTPVTGFSSTLAQSMTSSQLTLVLSSITIQGHTLETADYGFLYFTINPGAANQEVVKVTSNSGTTFTLTKRGLASYGAGDIELSNFKFNHSAGEPVIASNPKNFEEQLVRLSEDQTIAGIKTFSSSPVVPTPTSDTQAANKGYVDGVAIAGGADASTTTKGIAKLTTAPTSATDPIAVGATDVATTGASKVIRSKSNSKLDDSLLGLTTAGDLPYSDGTDLQRLAVGSSGLVLTSTGTYPAWQAIPAQVLVPRYKFSTIFETAARFTSTLGTSGTAVYGATGLTLSTGSSSASYANTTLQAGLTAKTNLFAGNPIFSTCLIINTYSSHQTSAGFYIGIGSVTSGAGYDFVTKKHIGFKIKDTGSALNVYGSVSDGTAETETVGLITSLAVNDMMELFFVKTGASVSFYYRVNGGTLSAAVTVTTHIPVDSDDGYLFQFAASNANTTATYTATAVSLSYERDVI